MKKRIANLLRILATALESEHCQATEEDLEPLYNMVNEAIDVYVGYEDIAKIKGKSVNAVRAESCRKGWKRKYNKVKVSLKDAVKD